MSKIVKIEATYDNGCKDTFLRDTDRWLFITKGPFSKQISLSGDGETDAFLLKMLDIAVTHQLENINVIGGVPR